MAWVGLVVLVAGGVVVLATDLTAVGIGVLGAGAVLLVAGILRLRRSRRAVGGPAAGAPYTPYRTGKGRIAAMIAAVLYIVSPVDLIPDVFLPVGVVDDAGALLWLAVALAQEVSRRSSAPQRIR
jgi:Protein of unknown function (DUF1232)